MSEEFFIEKAGLLLNQKDSLTAEEADEKAANKKDSLILLIEKISEYDYEFLNQEYLEDIEKISAVICGMANGNGGFIISGVEEEEKTESEKNNNVEEKIKLNIYGLPEDLKIKIPDENYFSEKINFEVHEFYVPEKIIILKIYPLIWHKRPLRIKNNNFIYRRYEGESFISGRSEKIKIANDGLNFSFDDFPAKNKNINPRSLEQFKNKIISIHPEFENLNNQEFLKKSFIYSGKFLTEAGFLMLGEDSVIIKSEFFYKNKIISLEADNLWNAYNHMLPKFEVSILNEECGEALREIFLNALIHSDYRISNKIKITITGNPAKIEIENPCSILRNSKYSSSSLIRNFRLKKIFELLKNSDNKNKKLNGMKIIKKYDPDFKLEQDMLNFSIKSSINLKALTELPEAIIL